MPNNQTEKQYVSKDLNDSKYDDDNLDLNDSISYNYNSVFLPNRVRDVMKGQVAKSRGQVRLPNITISSDFRHNIKHIHQQS